MCVIRRYFLACEDIAGGSELPAGEFFSRIQRPFRWVPAVRWRNHYFACNKEAFPCVRPWTQLSASPRTVHVRWKPFLDHVDHAAPRAPGRWTTARPRKGTTRSRGRRSSGCPRIEEYEGSLVRCGVRLPSPQGLASGGNSSMHSRPLRQHSRPREAGACGTSGAALGGWSKKTRG